MESQLKISVIIATYNRRDILPLTLEHLAKQTLPPSSFEVIVVDDGSPDDTEQVVSDIKNRLPYQLHYLKHANKGPGFTQNRGIKAAAAPIVCLIADDILLSPQGLEAHLEAHKKHPQSNAAILGKVVQSPRLAEKSIFLKKWDPFKFRLLENYSEVTYYYFWACNISCKKNFLLENGLYREQMGPAGAAAHEDVELGYRLWKKGLSIFYAKEALGYHYHIETLEGAIKRAYQRGLNWKEFRRLVDDPSVTVNYHILNFHTLKDHYQAYRKSGNNLIGIDKIPLLLILRHLLRISGFNFLTVPYFWLPLARQADKYSFIGSLMHTQIYRGVISYNFFKGVSDGYAGKIFLNYHSNTIK